MLKNLKKLPYIIVFSVLVAVTTLIFSSSLFSKDPVISEKDYIASQLVELSPNLKDVVVEDTEVDGIYQFWTGNVLNFVSYHDGHMLLGDVYNMTTKESLATVAQNKKISELVNTLPDSETIIFGDKDAKRTINVFTDVDCYYCRKLHEEVDQLTNAGIKVRYVMFPAYKRDIEKHTSVWCAEDQQKAMTLAKTGQAVPKSVCETPIDKTFKLGADLGFRGTPQIVFDNGTVVGGYKPASQIISELGL